MHPAVANSLFLQRPDPFRKYVGYAAAGHVLLLLLAWGASVLFNPPPLDLDQKPIHASLVRLGTARDKKLLPRMDEAPPPPKAPPNAAPPSPQKLNGATVVTPNKPASGAKDADAHRRELFNAFKQMARTADQEPLEGAADGAPNGDSAQQEGERYYGLLSAQVKRYYDVSDTISDQERIRLKALVHLTIGRAGNVIDMKLAQSSGNELFDTAVLQAVRRAAPFAPPPENLQRQLRNGVTLVFTP